MFKGLNENKNHFTVKKTNKTNREKQLRLLTLSL